jgi:predicted permease
MQIRRRLRSVLWRVPVEQEVREEIAHHIELRTRELIDRGMDPARAREEARGRFGDVAHMETQLAALGRKRNRMFAIDDWWAELRQDLRFAFRQARRQSGFTLAATLTLALGIGATTAIFSVVHAVVLQPLPVSDPDRLLFVSSTWRGRMGGYSAGNFDFMRRHVTTLDGLAAAQFFNFNLAEGSEPERVPGLRTTANFFAVWGVVPQRGRTYTQDEDRPGRAGVVVLSHRLWQRRFGGNAAIVGTSIRLNGEPHEIIGVMPSSFDEISWGTELFVPIAFTPERLAMHDEHFLDVFGRLKPGASLQQANAELERLAAQLAVDFPRDNTQRGAVALRLSDFLVTNYRTRLFVLLAAVALVLVIACANVANLLLARLAARTRELAVRAAIGAGRGRIVRQVLTESFVLALLGGVGGVLLARWSVPLLVAYAPAGTPRLEAAALNESVLMSALGLVIASTVLVGLLPAWSATRRQDLRDELGDGKGAAGGALRPWVRQTLIAAQAALVLIVLGSAALLVRSAINLQQVPVGFDVSGVLSARIALPAAQYRSAEHVKTTFTDILSRIQSSPGVSVAALDPQPPFVGGGGSNGLLPEGRPERMESVINSRAHFVSPDYFSVLRTPLRAGRTFTDQDTRSTPLVMIVNETLAREAFGGENPIGKRIGCCEGTPGNPSWKIVVGVVADVHARGPAEPPVPEFYLPVAQMHDVFWGWTQNTMSVIARAEGGDAAALTSIIRDAVKEVDPTLPLFRIATMEEGLRQTMAQARFNTLLMLLLGVTALVLAALGVYSVIAWLVAQRTREIGVRMALGASAPSVVRDVTMHGLKPVSAGLAIGLAGALTTGKLLETQLFQVDARDPLALAAVVAVMLIVGALAAIVPAWRASAIDPSKALHEG